MTDQNILSRLADFISLAKRHKKVDLTVSLDKQIVTRKFYPDIKGDSEDEIEMYILSAVYIFNIDGKLYEVPKFYVSGIEGESESSTGHNVYVANERLKMDYDRLKESSIFFVEKFWDEHLREKE